jgi:hypothetical protein
LTKSKKKLAKTKDLECLNCACPFNGQEKFCPDCGQKNKGNSITFKTFIHEVFNGLFSLDGKFWNTLIPLLTKPGVVSRNYIDGKRERYSNPFRFYLTVSIFFFLIVGFSINKNKFEKLAAESKDDTIEVTKDSYQIKKEILTKKHIDSLKKEVSNKMNPSVTPIPEAPKKQLLKEKEAEDTTAINMSKGNRFFSSLLKDKSKINKFINYQKKYPDSRIDQALDTLGYHKNFTNRFLYTRAKAANSLVKKDNREEYLVDLLSYGSISLFIFLPIFTLFLKLIYLRRRYTYIDHLIFVFHSQTVFFMLLTMLYLMTFFTSVNLDSAWVFLLLFLIYLVIAMKKFYQQGYIKTFIKFLMLNTVFIFLGFIGIVIVSLISFAFY